MHVLQRTSTAFYSIVRLIVEEEEQVAAVLEYGVYINISTSVIQKFVFNVSQS